MNQSQNNKKNFITPSGNTYQIIYDLDKDGKFYIKKKINLQNLINEAKDLTLEEKIKQYTKEELQQEINKSENMLYADLTKTNIEQTKIITQINDEINEWYKQNLNQQMPEEILEAINMKYRNETWKKNYLDNKAKKQQAYEKQEKLNNLNEDLAILNNELNLTNDIKEIKQIKNEIKKINREIKQIK